MQPRLLQVFRNTPFGRETFLQSIYFARTIDVSIRVYVPKQKRFLMYFENDVLQVDLDESYIFSPDTAEENVRQLLDNSGVNFDFVAPEHYTASSLPDLPIDYEFMCCPRSMSDPGAKIGLGYIGPKVRHVIKTASFPILIPSICYKEWNKISVLFGGSINAVKSLRLGIRLASRTRYPLEVFTIQEKGTDKRSLEKLIEERELAEKFDKYVKNWTFLDKSDVRESLYLIPHDSLLILGAYGHGLVRELIFGSKMEIVQDFMPNNLMVVGPNFSQ